MRWATVGSLARKARAEKADGGDPLLRVKQTLAYLNVGRTTLYSWQKKRGFPPPIRITCRCIGWRRSEIDAWLALHGRAAA